MSPVGTLAELMERIEQHARNENDILQEDSKVVAEQAKGPAKNVDKLEPNTYWERKEYGQAKKEPYREKRAPDPKVLVDSGSCIEVLYYDAFKKLGLTQADLVQSMTPLVEFDAGAVWPLGKVMLSVWAGTVILRTDFLVVDVPSSYNAIIGKMWLHKMRAISSTYHQMAPKAKLVQAIENPNQPTIEDVGANPAEKMVEGLKKVQINETNPERYFLVGENLCKEEEKELVGFLKEHVDVFAWVPEEMPAVDANVICHHLNVDPQHKPMMQKKRRLAVQHMDTIIEEVDRLLEAKAIREVYYP
ncbi:uncharacterized protein LOC131299681 [Rhododendron vialii]|uniref:uncharacterized protein LOC131299681 n=1 Tax=Rhododendron vialii TaxID=182163 RepID=UPI00265FDAF6|nr:uncharacterized protein LOC131299681 [Rhododendron vialii]